MSGTMIEFHNGQQQYRGYLASPAQPGPAVVVIQEWWGLVGHVTDICDRLAEQGFNALAPDFYHGEKTTSPDAAGKLMMALNIADASNMIQGAINALLSHPSTTGAKVGTVGFCMGGQLSLYAAAAFPETVGACVDYYGVHPNVAPPLENLQAPVLGFFAGRDGFVTPEVAAALETRLRELGKAVEFHHYPDCDHAFFNDARPAVYNAEAALETWNKTLAFFRQNLV